MRLPSISKKHSDMVKPTPGVKDPMKVSLKKGEEVDYSQKKFTEEEALNDLLYPDNESYQ